MNTPSKQPATPRSPPVVVVAHESADISKFFAYVLKEHFTVRAVTDAAGMLALAHETPRPGMVLLSLTLKDIDGYEACRRLKADTATARIPVIFLASQSDAKEEARGLSLGAVDYLLKPYSPPLILARVRAYISLQTRQHALERMVAQRTQELQQTRLQIIRRLALAAEQREGGLPNRLLRVSHYVKLLAQGLGLPAETCEALHHAAPLYDIGKLGVPESILTKTDKLTRAEQETMQKHAEIGARIIGEHADPLLETARIMALTHHERWDGGGYPKGLKGDAIPWPGRIAALADVFEAMTMTQYYREPMEVPAAAQAIAEQSGKQFDARLVAAFRKALPKMVEVKNAYPDEHAGMHELNFMAATTTMPPKAAPPRKAAASRPSAGGTGWSPV